MPSITLNSASLNKLKRGAKIPSDHQLAIRAGIHPSQYARVAAGKCAPGNRFIAGMLIVFGQDRFSDLFTVKAD